MDVLRIIEGVLGSVQALLNLLKVNKRVSVELKNGLRFISNELAMIKWDIQQCKDLQLQELAYEIDDFIHGLWIPGPYTGYILLAVAMNPGTQDIDRINFFRESIKSLQDRIKSSEATQSGASATPSPLSSAGSPPCYASEDLVGITTPKKEIVELLSRPDGPLRVISIVGCSGVGKTALARALYDDAAVTNEFDHTAWVVASDHSPVDILNNILQHFDLAALQHFPKNKRYLVFVDDVWREGIPWEDIERAFHENDMGSRIIVTTSVPSVARACSSGSYLYTMQRLDQPNSRELFLRKVRRKVPGNPTAHVHALHDDCSESIIDICDGLPLALISAANYLRGKGRDPTREDCEGVSQALGDCPAGKRDGFEEMRRALVQCYDNLPDHVHKNCLLYVSIFPRGHQINSKSLVRRLIAEGLVPDAHIMKAQESVVRDVCECLEKLIDQSIIEPALSCNDSKVAKRCQVHSIMLEFTIKKSVSKNFLSLIHKDKPLHNTGGSVRRLTV